MRLNGKNILKLLFTLFSNSLLFVLLDHVESTLDKDYFYSEDYIKYSPGMNKIGFLPIPIPFF